MASINFHKRVARILHYSTRALQSALEHSHHSTLPIVEETSLGIRPRGCVIRTSGGAIRPRGCVIRPRGGVIYPRGCYSSQGVCYSSQGVYYLSQGVCYSSEGVCFSPQGVCYWSHGVWYLSQGVRYSSQGGCYFARYTVPGTSLTDNTRNNGTFRGTSKVSHRTRPTSGGTSGFAL